MKVNSPQLFLIRTPSRTYISMSIQCSRLRMRNPIWISTLQKRTARRMQYYSTARRSCMCGNGTIAIRRSCTCCTAGTLAFFQLRDAGWRRWFRPAWLTCEHNLLFGKGISLKSTFSCRKETFCPKRWCFRDFLRYHYNPKQFPPHIRCYAGNQPSFSTA